MFFTVVYVFYDILFLEIPESVLLIFNAIIFGGLTLASLAPAYNFFPNYSGISGDFLQSLVLALVFFA